MSGVLQALLASFPAAGNAGLFAWGLNSNGELGDLTTASRSSPVQVDSASGWTAVSGGRTSGGVKDGQLWMWGYGSFGVLGDGTATSKSSPVQIGALTNWSEVSISAHCLAIKTDGTMWSWGRGDNGRLGTGSTANRSSPVQIGALTTWAKAAAIGSNGFAIKTDGTFWSWGGNYRGELAQNVASNTYQSSPNQIGALTTWASIGLISGGTTRLAIRTDGVMFAWGQNYSGIFASGAPISARRSSPVQVNSDADWSQVSSSGQHAVATKTNGTLWAWGNNNNGSLGNGSRYNTVYAPLQIGALTTWTDVATTSSRPANGALKNDGTLWTWGDGRTYGQLGHNDVISRSSPTQVGSDTNWIYIAAGNSSMLAVTE
jgi:alpha-tubulin suppressor-like RCC1 family protein